MIEKKNLQITADDFGISKIATKNILELVKDGKIDRVEVMMSKNITQEQVRYLLDSGVKIDIHLHLKSEILDEWQERKEEFVEGSLKRITVFIWDYFFSRDRVSETEAEWFFQLNDFKKLFGRYPDGISSHEHIHYFPAYFKIVIEIASQKNIPFIRFGKGNFKSFAFVSLILNFLRFFDQKVYRKFQNKIKTTDCFVSFDWIKEKNNPLAEIPSSREVELVFHLERNDEYEFLKKQKNII